LRAIESLTVSLKNYNVSWDILKKWFCNKRLIVHDHIIAITKAPQVIKASHSSLRCFLDMYVEFTCCRVKTAILEVPIDIYLARSSSRNNCGQIRRQSCKRMAGYVNRRSFDAMNFKN
jgi:hypothetical protein